MVEMEPLLRSDVEISSNIFTSIKTAPHGKRPQAIAHRGYKAAHPENTMAAFIGAVKIGAHAIETDLHLTKDGVVVLSHDPTLKRCYGREEKITDCEWSYLSTMRTIAEPHEPMPRLLDLLEYLSSPGLEDIWVLLDVKVPTVPTLKEALWSDGSKQEKCNVQVDALFKAIAKTLDGVKSATPWNQRVMVGCWAARYLPLGIKHLPTYPLTHIGFSPSYAGQFLQIPGMNLNMFQQLMIGPSGTSLLASARKAGSSVFLWTVNDETWMKWSIRKGVDGVVTDDPKKYLEVCERYAGEKVRVTWREWRTWAWWNWMVLWFGLAFRVRHGWSVDVGKVEKARKGV